MGTVSVNTGLSDWSSLLLGAVMSDIQDMFDNLCAAWIHVGECYIDLLMAMVVQTHPYILS